MLPNYDKDTSLHAQTPSSLDKGFYGVSITQRVHMGVSENRGGSLFWGPYNKDPII